MCRVNVGGQATVTVMRPVDPKVIGSASISSKEKIIAESGIGRRRAAAKKDGGAGYAARRQELVRVASQLFREQGYEATSLNDIAERLQTDRATLYYYIGGKDELLQEVVAGVTGGNLQVAEELLVQDLPAVEKVSILIRQILESYEENYPQVFVYIQEGMTRIARQRSSWAKKMVAQNHRLEVILRQILQDGMDSGELRSDVPVDLAAQAIWGMVNWAHRWFKPGGRHDVDEIATHFTSIFIDGMIRKQSR
jgi:AcrR family transcriptional regulator